MTRAGRFTRALLLAGAATAALHTAGGSALADVSRAQEVRARTFKLLSEGIQAYKEGRQKEAIALLRQASNIALNSFKAYYYLGLALKADRQYQAAMEPLQTALELTPGDLQAHVALGDCYLKKGDPAEALAEYHRALTLKNDYAPAHDGLGRASEASGDDEKAIEHYRRAIELNPGFPDSSLNLGDLFMRENRHNEAIDLFLKAIRVRPDFAAAYNRLGVAYARQRLGNEAISALRQAQVLEKGNPWHPVTIGGIYLELDNLVQAGREFDHALTLDADYLEGYLARAGLMRRKGELEEAAGVLDVGLARDVEDARLKVKMREMKEQLAREVARFTGLNERLRSDPADPAALAGLADLKVELGDHAAAAQLYGQAVAAGAASDGLLLKLGYSQLRAEMYPEAALVYEKLCAAAPSDADLLINLGLARMGGGDAAGAEQALREAGRIRPGDVRPLTYLGNLYAMTGQTARAVEALQSALGLMGEGAEERQRVQRLVRALQPAETGGS